jgi:hypothetical protein
MQLNQLTLAIRDRNGNLGQKSVNLADGNAYWEGANSIAFQMHNPDEYVVLEIPSGLGELVFANNEGGAESVGLLPVSVGDAETGYVSTGREIKGAAGQAVRIGYPPGRTGVVTVTVARATPLEPDKKDEAPATTAEAVSTTAGTNAVDVDDEGNPVKSEE